MKVDCLVINFNGRRYLPELIESLKSQLYKEIEIWILDNNSFDDSREYLQNVDGINLIQFEENHGIGPAVNRVMNKLTGEYVFILNMDLSLDKECIVEMVSTFREIQDAFCVDALSYDENDRPLHGKFIQRSRNFFYYIFRGLRFRAVYPEKVVETPFACAGHMMMKTNKLREIGGFHDDFFLEWEDFYVCYKARLMKNWKTYFNPRAKVKHIVGGAIKPHKQDEDFLRKLKLVRRRREESYFNNKLYIILLLFPFFEKLGLLLNHFYVYPLKQLITFHFSKIFIPLKSLFWVIKRRKLLKQDRKLIKR